MKKNYYPTRYNFMRFCLTLLFFTTCEFSTFSQTVTEIMSKHINAIGGKAKLDAISSFTYEMGSKIIYYKKSGMWRIDNLDSGKIKETTIYHGEKGWNIFDNTNVQPSYTSLSLSGQADNIFLVSYLAYANAPGYKIEYRGLEKGADNLVLEVTPLVNNSIGASYTYYINPKTYLITKSTINFEGPSVVYYFKNYKTVSGIQVPLTITVENEDRGTSTELVRTKVKINIPLNNKLFADPTLKK
jgi:hypothetical protein